MEPNDTMTYQPAPAPAEPQMPPQPAPRSSSMWLVLAGIAIIAVLGAAYWMMMKPVQPEMMQPTANEQAAAAITAEANIVAQELDALSTDGLDAELDQIDAELAQ